MAKKIIGFTELKDKYLPHRYPLIMIDRVTDYEPGEYIEAIKCVTGNSPEIVGHFPEERAIMPATQVLQGFAQLAIVFFLVSNGPLGEDEMTLITSVKSKFMKPIFPGDTIHMSLKPKKLTETTAIVNCDAKVDGQSTIRGSLTLAKTNVSRFPDAPW